MVKLSIVSTGLAFALVGGSLAHAAEVLSRNVINLSATGRVEVAQDTLSLTLSATREDVDAIAVQQKLRKVVNAALTQLRQAAIDGQFDVHSGDFSVRENRDRDGQLTGWTSQAQLVVSGRDFTRITEAAARVPNMAVSNVLFSVSQEQAERAREQAQKLAIQRFQTQATQVVQGFGLTSYFVREVSINNFGGAGYGRSVPMLASVHSAAEKSAPAVPIQMQAGRTLIEVTVTGSIQAQ